jgi:predicted RNA-binding Zn ribbon-like protein
VPFEHDTEMALTHAAALVNTEPSDDPDAERPELLADLAALNDFLTDWEWTGARVRTNDGLQQVRDLRPRLRAMWTAPEREQVDRINDLLAEYRAQPRLVEHGDLGWHIHATDDDAPMHERMGVEAAMALIDLIRAGETERLRTCAGEDCENILIDLSRNRSKIYCDVGCANRAHAAAYRARRQDS